jgi:uncharacterized membrane protein (DUF373 family)
MITYETQTSKIVFFNLNFNFILQQMLLILILMEIYQSLILRTIRILLFLWQFLNCNLIDKVKLPYKN